MNFDTALLIALKILIEWYIWVQEFFIRVHCFFYAATEPAMGQLAASHSREGPDSQQFIRGAAIPQVIVNCFSI